MISVELKTIHSDQFTKPIYPIPRKRMIHDLNKYICEYINIYSQVIFQILIVMLELSSKCLNSAQKKNTHKKSSWHRLIAQYILVIFPIVTMIHGQ